MAECALDVCAESLEAEVDIIRPARLSAGARPDTRLALRVGLPRTDQGHARHEAALADLGLLVLKAHDVTDVLRGAVAVLQALIDTDIVLVLRRAPGHNAFSLEVGANGDTWLAPEHLVPEGSFSQTDVLHSPSPVVVQNLGLDERFVPLSVGGCDVATSGVLATIQGEDGPWGLLAAYSTTRVAFSDGALQFVRAVANNIASAVAYGRARRTLLNLVDYSPDPCARFDAELRVQYANAAMVHATGFPAQELTGRTFRELGLMVPQLDALEALVQAVLRSGREREADFCLSSPFGDRFYHVRFVPELATDASTRSVLAMARDVTGYKKADDERACLQLELIERDRRDGDLLHQLLAEQQRVHERDVHADDRSQIVSQLTLRETDILRLLAGGLTNRQIARQLHLSPGTVRNHLGRVFPKLDAIDRTQAAVRAVELGLIQAEGA